MQGRCPLNAALPAPSHHWCRVVVARTLDGKLQSVPWARRKTAGLPACQNPSSNALLLIALHSLPHTSSAAPLTVIFDPALTPLSSSQACAQTLRTTAPPERSGAQLSSWKYYLSIPPLSVKGFVNICKEGHHIKINYISVCCKYLPALVRFTEAVLYVTHS